MKTKRIPIEQAIHLLESNLDWIARVTEWAEAMGYRSHKNFRRVFVRYYQINPGKVLTAVRLIHIMECLEKDEQKSGNEIAWQHSMKDHNELYAFVKYHTGYSPTNIKEMEPGKRRELINKLIKNFQYKIK
jgi:transcriptional regulator GlxA family with amidase domain